MMKLIIFIASLTVLMLISQHNQNNSTVSAAGNHEANMIVPGETRTPFYGPEYIGIDPVPIESEPNADGQLSSYAMETFLSGKCMNNVLIIL